MAAQGQQKPRKRIVPQLIAPSPTKLPDAYDGLPPPSPQLQVTDLREQAEFAKEHLGLDRKIYVDLRPYRESNKAVNWKQLLKERGAKPAGRVPRGGSSEEPGAEVDLMSRGHNPRQAANPLLRVLRRLEQTYCTKNESDEDSDNSQEEEDDSSGSDMDDEAGSGGNATDGGGRTDAEAVGPDGLVVLPMKKKRADKAPAGGDDYDHADDWIDDEEFFEMHERSDKRKTKFEGFFITRGEIERTEEMLPGFSPEKARKPAAAPKRKLAEGGGFDSGSDFQAAPPPKPRAAVKEGGEGGEKKAAKRKAEGEGEEPAKKKKKRVVAEAIAGAAPAPGQAHFAAPPAAQEPKKLSMAQQAAALGAMASAGVLRAGTSVSPDHRLHAPAAALPPTPADVRPAGSIPPPPPSAKRATSEPYEVRPEVAAAMSSLRQVAEAAQRQLPPEPPAPAQGEEAATRRKVPPAVKAALDTFSTIFCRETEGNPGAARRLLDDLEKFMIPFCSRQTLSTTLRKAASKSDKSAPSMMLEGLKGLLANIAPPPPPKPAAATAAVAAGNSDDDFQQPSTQALASQQQQQQPVDGGAAAPSASAGAAAGTDGKPKVAYTHVPAAMRKQIFQRMHALLGDKAANTQEAKAVIQAVFNTFPPGVITTAGVKKIYTSEKTRVANATKAALAGQAQPASSQQPGQPKKAGSGQPSRAPSPALTTTSLAAQQYAQAAAQAAQAKLAPAAAPEAGAVQPAVPADQPAAGEAATHPAASTATAGADALAGVASEALVPLMSDEDVVAMGVQHGAAAEALREVLAGARLSKSQYAGGVARVLMLAGPGGVRLSEVAAKAQELRFAAGWEGSKVSRAASKLDFVARLAMGRYALRAFPGVVHVPPPEKPAKSAGASLDEAADGGAGGVGQAPAEPPAAELPAALPVAAQEGAAQGEGSA